MKTNKSGRDDVEAIATQLRGRRTVCVGENGGEQAVLAWFI
ncbi:hypothetical protein [Nitrosovibrio tenuis]|uniref:Uncharacterized protein n=1 Tax=Nitrosovibrio tenuis TaxID=1233 RepID=A0A1H7QPJ4_9PROT|nr:hypothetical protein [Nitrosovibrio tenuis]SEL49829.1 hypothetical protein SAMN05216387_1135 [Nitrosovibrio tenuis]